MTGGVKKSYLVLSFVLLLGLVLGAFSARFGQANALSGSQWRADRIIDDANFYNGDAMSESAIQDFLNSKVPTCDTNHAKSSSPNDSGPPYTCLKDYSQSVPGMAADSFCPGSISAGTKSAARIIYEVSRVCNISPKVLLITLQKEQSLITDTWPWDIQYTKATGYGCPDTSLGVDVDENQNGCYDQYEGFFKQIYYAARQFQRYKIDSHLFNHRAGQTSRVYYNPDTSCGYTNVTMYNHATAGLYNYTPYQPNQAALNNLYGTGDECSAYGNRNFWRMYWDWFGNPFFDPNQDTVLIGDWDGDGDDTPSIRRGNRYYIDLGHDGEVDTEFGFGLATDQHLVGDWDGDGSDEIGLKRGERYYFSFDFNGTSEIYQGFGNPTDVALVGDWDGDGADEIGLKRGERYYLNFNYDGKAELYVGFGNASDSAFVGDWDGDGDDNIALRRIDHYFFDYGHDGEADARFGYGSSFHKVIVGDWDGNGRDSMGLKNGEFHYLDNNLDGRTDIYSGIGNRSDKGIVGDWDNNGSDELGVKRENYFFLDFNFDGRSDLLIQYKY